LVEIFLSRECEKRLTVQLLYQPQECVVATLVYSVQHRKAIAAI